MQRLGVEPASSFQRLAVNRDMPRGAAATGSKAAKSLGQGIAIKRLKNIMISGVAWRPLNAKER